jgi:hypothetical protein
LAALLALGFLASANGQTADLPDSPGYLMQAAIAPAGTQIASSSADNAGTTPAVTAPVSPMYPTSHPYLHRIVKPGMGPQPLTAGQKFNLALRSPYSLVSFGTNIVTSGESHLADSRPHYGTDKAGYGERLGAAELKTIDETFFSYGLYAALFHDDPHYYIMGSSHGVKERAIYSASRIVLTRKDNGNTGVNWPKLLGLASAGALTNAYYPDRDRGVSKTLTAYFSNLGTSAATLELNEFLPDVMKSVRHKKK